MEHAATRRVMAILEGARPGCARFVGGCVRDALMRRAVSDIDIATQLKPDEVAAAMRAAGVAVHETGIEHGTLTVVADHRPFEVTTLRRDVETDGRRATVAFTENWAEDAARRDFRMNALYADLAGRVFDPTGGGLEDVRLGRVIFVGDPETRIREDYLRILRFFRFSAWFASTEPDTPALNACSRLAAGVSGLSAERVWAETRKLLAAPDPRAAFSAMCSSGVFAHLYPWSPGTSLVEKLIALDRLQNAPADSMLRLLALTGLRRAAVEDAVRGLKLSNAEALRLRNAVRDPSPFEALRTADPEPAVLRQILYSAGAEAVHDCARLALAEDPASERWKAAAIAALGYKRPVLPVTGADLLAAGFPSGRELGLMLRTLEDAWIQSDFEESRNALLARIQPKA